MKTKATGWTPGPWKVHSHGSNSKYIADITGRDSKRSRRFIRTVAVVLRYAGQSEGEANAGGGARAHQANGADVR